MNKFPREAVGVIIQNAYNSYPNVPWSEVVNEIERLCNGENKPNLVNTYKYSGVSGGTATRREAMNNLLPLKILELVGCWMCLHHRKIGTGDFCLNTDHPKYVVSDFSGKINCTDTQIDPDCPLPNVKEKP